MRYIPGCNCCEDSTAEPCTVHCQHLLSYYGFGGAYYANVTVSGLGNDQSEDCENFNYSGRLDMFFNCFGYSDCCGVMVDGLHSCGIECPEQQQYNLVESHISGIHAYCQRRTCEDVTDYRGVISIYASMGYVPWLGVIYGPMINVCSDWFIPPLGQSYADVFLGGVTCDICEAADWLPWQLACRPCGCGEATGTITAVYI